MLTDATPLFKEKGGVCPSALAIDVADPFNLHFPSTRPAFAADDCPIDPLKINFSDSANERLKREKPHRCRHSLKVRHTMDDTTILNADPHPYVGSPIKFLG